MRASSAGSLLTPAAVLTTRMSRFFCAASGRSASTTCSIRGNSANAVTSGLMTPDSIFEMSSRLSKSCSSVDTDSSMPRMTRCEAGLATCSCRTEVYMDSACMGWRRSWLAAAGGVQGRRRKGWARVRAGGGENFRLPHFRRTRLGTRLLQAVQEFRYIPGDGDQGEHQSHAERGVAPPVLAEHQHERKARH